MHIYALEVIRNDGGVRLLREDRRVIIYVASRHYRVVPVPAPVTGAHADSRR